MKYDIAGFRPKVGVNLGFLTKAEYIRTGEDRWDIEKFYIENMRKKFSKGVVVFENFEEKLQLDKTDDVEDKKMYINLLIHSTTDSEVIKVLNNELKRLENEK